MQRQPEDEKHDQNGAHPVDHCAVGDGGELLVGDWHRAGQADPRAIFAFELEVGRGLPDCVGCVLARLERVEIEDRLELDEGPPIGVGQRLVADQFAP